jgi:hypothetical protein
LEPAEVVLVVTGMGMSTTTGTGMGAGLLPGRQAPKNLHTSKRPAPLPVSLPLPIHLPVTTKNCFSRFQVFQVQIQGCSLQPVCMSPKPQEIEQKT